MASEADSSPTTVEQLVAAIPQLPAVTERNVRVEVEGVSEPTPTVGLVFFRERNTREDINAAESAICEFIQASGLVDMSNVSVTMRGRKKRE